MEASTKIRRVGLAQKLLLWAFLASIFGWVIPYGFLAAIPFELYCIWRLAQALEKHWALRVVYLLAMFVPLISMLALLHINGEATKILREEGIRVGLMGAKTSDLPLEGEDLPRMFD